MGKIRFFCRDSGNEELLYISFVPGEVLRSSVCYNVGFEGCEDWTFPLTFEMADDEYFMDVVISVNTLSSLSIVYKKRCVGSDTYIYEDLQTFRVMKKDNLFVSLNEDEGYGDRRE